MCDSPADAKSNQFYLIAFLSRMLYLLIRTSLSGYHFFHITLGDKHSLSKFFKQLSFQKVHNLLQKGNTLFNFQKNIGQLNSNGRCQAEILQNSFRSSTLLSERFYFVHRKYKAKGRRPKPTPQFLQHLNITIIWKPELPRYPLSCR